MQCRSPRATIQQCNLRNNLTRIHSHIINQYMLKKCRLGHTNLAAYKILEPLIGKRIAIDTFLTKKAIFSTYTAKKDDDCCGQPFAVQTVCLYVHKQTVCAHTVPLHLLCTGSFVHKSSTKQLCSNGWRIFWSTVCCPFVHKQLMYIVVDRLLFVCERMVDRYIGTKRKRKFNENQENNTFGECKQSSQEKKIYIGLQADSKRLTNVLVHKRSHVHIYIHLLSEHR